MMKKTVMPIFAVILSLIFVFSFQNCAKTSFYQINLPVNKMDTDNNGGYYPGLTRTYYHFVPDFSCEQKPAAESILEVSNTSVVLTENKTLICNANKKSIAVNAIDTSIYQNTIVGYQEEILEAVQSEPTSIPANLVEVWCKDRNDDQGIESIMYYDRTQQLAVNRIYYSDQSSNQAVVQVVPDFMVSRVVGASSVIIRDNKNFQLTVFRDQPASQVGLFNARMDWIVNGQNKSRDTFCRLGGSLDARLWPVKQIVDMSVSALKMAPDNQTIAFTSASGAVNGVATLYTSNVALTSSQKRVAPFMLVTGVNSDEEKWTGTSFKFTPDSKALIYSGDPRIATGHELFRVNVDGTNNIQLSQPLSDPDMSVGPDFVTTADGSTIIYREDNFFSGNKVFPTTVLKSVSALGGGVSKTLSPPVTALLTNGLVAFNYDTSSNKVIFVFSSDSVLERTLSVNPDGTNLFDINPSLPISAGWNYGGLLLSSLMKPGKFLALSKATSCGANYVCAPSNYIIPYDGSGSFLIPAQALSWEYADPTGSYAVLMKLPYNSLSHSLAMMNIKTKVIRDLPALKNYTQTTGEIDLSSMYFNSQSTALIALREVSGLYQPISIDTASGAITNLCNITSPQMKIYELSPGKNLAIAFDPTSKVIDIYLATETSCNKLNSAISTIEAGVLISDSISNDRQKIVLNISGQLIYLPLDGRASYIVNSPSILGAQVKTFGFDANSKYIYFMGDQIRKNEDNVFIWSVPQK